MEHITWFKERQIKGGTKIKAYFNIHKNLFSFVAMEGEYRGRVVGHSSNLILSDVEFKVSKAGNRRVLLERHKNVHAFVVGSLCGAESADKLPEIEKNIVKKRLGDFVTYNPRKADYFYSMATGKRIDTAKAVMLLNKKVWVI